MFEDQQHQTVTAEDSLVDAKTDGDGTATDFIRVKVVSIELSGQDAIEGSRTQWTVIVGEIFFVHHFEVAVDVDAMHAAADQHPRLVVLPIECAGDGLVFGDGSHVDQRVVCFGFLVAEQTQFLIVVNRHDQGFGGQVVHHFLSLLLELLQHLLLFLCSSQLHLSHRLRPTQDRLLCRRFLFFLEAQQISDILAK